MSKTVYDTRFFMEHYYSANGETIRKTREELRKTKERYISAIVIHEVYRLTLEREGREVAKLRKELLEKDFKVVDVNPEIATTSAEIRHKYNIPLADSVIAATSVALDAKCFTDDSHLKEITELKTMWIS
jgi:predicted nucleic acid-binding protein